MAWATGSKSVRVEVRDRESGDGRHGSLTASDNVDATSADSLDFDTAVLPAEQRFAAFQSGLPFYRLSTPDPAGFEARVRAWELASVIVVDADVSPIRFIRNERRAQSDQREEVMLHLIVSGCLAGRTDDRAMLALPGDIAIHDRREPVEAVLARGRHIAVSLPGQYLEEALPHFDLHGAALGGGDAHLLKGFMSALPGTLADASPDPAELARVTRDVIAAAVRGSDATVAVARDSSLRNRVKRYVTRHIGEPLDVPGLCGVFGVSRSALYRAFEREGGVMRHVRARRLARMHRLLSDPAERRAVSELARRNGFPDPAHFSRLFRDTFGHGPQALRRSVSRRCDGGVAKNEAIDTFKAWEDARS